MRRGLEEVDRMTNRRTRVLPIAALSLMLGACTPIGATNPPAGTGTPAAGSPGGSPPVGSPPAGVTQLSIATGGTGGVYYPLGGGFATVIRKYVPGHDATIQETNASVDNMRLIESGGADLAFSLGDTAADAVSGSGPFDGTPIAACTLGRLYDNYTQLITSSESGIATVADLAGKRVSVGAPESGTEIIALRILEAAGIDPDSGIQRQQLGIDDTVGGLRDGTIDAGFWSGGLPTGAVVEYATSGDLVIVPTGEFTEQLATTYGEYYIEADIPADSYEGQTEAVSTIIVPNVLVTSPDMSEDLQRQITAAIFEHEDELVAVHAAAEALDAATAGDVAFMDVCPGAQTFFEEQ
jgi:TRAP transporter TAXI family solute receptor